MLRASRTVHRCPRTTFCTHHLVGLQQQHGPSVWFAQAYGITTTRSRAVRGRRSYSETGDAFALKAAEVSVQLQQLSLTGLCDALRDASVLFLTGIDWDRCDDHECALIAEKNESFTEVDPWADDVADFLSNQQQSGDLPMKIPAILNKLEVPSE